MTFALATVGLLVLALGVLGLVRPATLVGFAERSWASPAGLYLAVAIRLALGVFLVAAASSTRLPWTVGGIGVLSLVAAAAIPVLGYERMHRFVAWWAARPAAFVRAWSLVVCAFGAFLVYAAA